MTIDFVVIERDESEEPEDFEHLQAQKQLVDEAQSLWCLCEDFASDDSTNRELQTVYGLSKVLYDAIYALFGDNIKGLKD